MDENGLKADSRTTDTRGRRYNRLIEQRLPGARRGQERRRGCASLFASLVIGITIWLDGGVAAVNIGRIRQKDDTTRGQLTKT